MRKFFPNFVTLLVTIIVSFLFTEVAIRIIYKDKYAKRPIFLKYDKKFSWVTNKNLKHMFYGKDFSFHVETDEYGYRLGPRGQITNDDSLIVFVGDSFAFGWGVSGHQTFPAYFDEILATLGKNLRVVNIAVVGHGTLEIAERLNEFLGRFDPKKIKAVLVFHHFNDTRGNFRYLLFKSGFLEPIRDPKFNPGTISHLVNFANFTVSRYYSKEKREENKPDLLLPFPLKRTIKSKGVIKIDEQWEISREKIDLKTETRKIMFSRGYVTELNKKLIIHGIKKINLLAKDYPVFHAVINYSPTWFESEIRSCFYNSHPDINKYFIGKLRTDLYMDANMLNAHGGGHFTPEYNKHYAEKLFTLIKDDIIY